MSQSALAQTVADLGIDDMGLPSQGTCTLATAMAHLGIDDRGLPFPLRVDEHLHLGQHQPVVPLRLVEALDGDLVAGLAGALGQIAVSHGDGT